MEQVQVENIPQKSHFKFQEVCDIIGIKPYVLRFWESEFDVLNVITSATGQKVFTYEDLMTVLEIKELLLEQKIPIERAKHELYNKIKRSGEDDLNLNELSEIHVEEDIPLSLEFNESQLQKIILARAKLTSLINLIEETKSLI